MLGYCQFSVSFYLGHQYVFLLRGIQYILRSELCTRMIEIIFQEKLNELMPIYQLLWSMVMS